MQIKIKQTLSESVSFYKNNFIHFALPSFFYSSVLLLLQMVTLIKLLKEYPVLLVCSSIVLLTIMFATIVVLPKVEMSSYIIAHSLLSGNKINFGQAYRQTSGKYWTMVGYLLLVGLFCLPAYLLLFRVDFSSIYFSLYYAIITSLFYTLRPMIAIVPKSGHYLKRAFQMTKAHYWQVLVLTLITSTSLILLKAFLSGIYQNNSFVLMAIDISHAIAYFFVWPLSVTVVVIIYRKLSVEMSEDNK